MRRLGGGSIRDGIGVRCLIQHVDEEKRGVNYNGIEGGGGLHGIEPREKVLTLVRCR